MSLRGALTLLAALGALSLAACGGDDDEDGGALSAEEYDERAEAALQTIVELDELSAPLANPESVEQYVAGVRAISAEVDGTAAELEALEPPENVAAAHDDLIAAIEAFGAKFPPVADAAESGDDAALRAGATALQSAEAEFATAIADVNAQLEAEGIDVAPLGD